MDVVWREGRVCLWWDVDVAWVEDDDVFGVGCGCCQSCTMCMCLRWDLDAGSIGVEILIMVGRVCRWWNACG